MGGEKAEGVVALEGQEVHGVVAGYGREEVVNY